MDFVAEFSGFFQEEIAALVGKPWILFMDSSSCQIGGGLGVYLTSSNGQEHYCMATLTFKVTNNEVEYETLVTRLRVAHLMGVSELANGRKPGTRLLCHKGQKAKEISGQSLGVMRPLLSIQYNLNLQGK